jgi:hypothetical protein
MRTRAAANRVLAGWVTGLARQPGGFEGVRATQIAAYSDGLPMPEGPDVVRHRFHGDATAAPRSEEAGGDGDVVAVIHKLLRLPPEVAEGFAKQLKEAANAVVPVPRLGIEQSSAGIQSTSAWRYSKIASSPESRKASWPWRTIAKFSCDIASPVSRGGEAWGAYADAGRAREQGHGARQGPTSAKGPGCGPFAPGYQSPCPLPPALDGR